MCRRVTCSTCNKPSYAGCGAHVEQVLGDVPREERCRCRDEKSAPRGDAPLWKKILGLWSKLERAVGALGERAG